MYKAEKTLKSAVNRIQNKTDSHGNFSIHVPRHLSENCKIAVFNNCIKAFVYNTQWYFGRDAIEFLIKQAKNLGLSRDSNTSSSILAQILREINEDVYGHKEFVSISYGHKEFVVLRVRKCRTSL